jgi:bifunctional DNase/RNase
MILGVEGEKLRIPIIIGPYEAQAIAIELEGLNPSRPLTHDLVRNILKSIDVQIVEVNINRFYEGVFYALITLFDGTKNIEIDSRTSDAVALAVRFNCPIYADDKVIDSTAIEEDIEEIDDLEDENLEEIEDGDIELANNQTIEELEDYLKVLIELENYEEASKVRDEIQRKKSKNNE